MQHHVFWFAQYPVFKIYNVTVVNNLFPQAKKYFFFSNTTAGFHSHFKWSMFATSASMGKIFGTLIGAAVADHLGRKPSLYLVCTLLISGGAGTAAIHIFHNFISLVIPRVVIGMGSRS